MTDYLDIGVIRIQSWLTRTPKLRGRRGASTMIRNATDPDAIDTVLRDTAVLAERNTEPGHIDGVVPLVLLDTSEAAVDEVIQHLARHLREQLPAVGLKVSRYAGETYQDARVTGPLLSTEWAPAVAEWPPGRPCQWCHRWPASRVVPRGAEPGEPAPPLCVDCAQRAENSGFNTSPTELPGPERDLVVQLRNSRRALSGDVPNTFRDLARLGPDRDNTHLATVYADGNAIGRCITELRQVQRTGATDINIPREIDDATWTALLTALEAINDPRQNAIPAIPHLVGGDDVLISLPAHRAWLFTRNLQETFTARLSSAFGEFGVEPPTISAAVVFHHETAPIATVIGLAEELLSYAKAEHHGKTPALAWQDITRNGPEQITRPSLPHSRFTENWSELEELADLANTQRHRLANLLHDPPPNEHDLDNHIARLDLTEVVAPFRAESNPDLTDALGMVRWWWKA